MTDTDIVNSENILDTLRGISQRRRTGSLGISLKSHELEISFVNGRVVELTVDHQVAVISTSEWIARCFPEIAEADAVTYSDLSSWLTRNKGMSGSEAERWVKLINRERALASLYAIEGVSSGKCFFKVDSFSWDQKYSPNISVGQLLLDFVELNQAKELLAERVNEGTIVVLSSSDIGDGISDEEKLVLQVICNGATVKNLRDSLPLCKFHFDQALYNLMERGYVIAERTDPVTPLDDVSVAGVIPDFKVTRTESLEKRLLRQSTSLLKSPLIPSLIALGFLLLASLAPLVMWWRVFEAFAG